MTFINSKLPHCGTTIFTVMSSLAAEHNAINLGQGFPDYPMDEALTQLVCRAMKDGYNQYVHMNGYLPLRESISEKIKFLYGSSFQPDSEITITPGGTYAIYTALTAIIQPGDEVIIFEPAYDSYQPGIELSGGKAIRIPLNFPTYSYDWDKVKAAITPKTRAIIINSPHNPTGSILQAADLTTLSEIVISHDLFLISDEVYEHLIFDNKQHESVLRYPALRNHLFACYSFGKVYNCTGWKLGYCVAPEKLMQEFRKVHQFNCFSCNSPVQVALAAYLKEKDAYLRLGAELQQKRDFLQQQMRHTRFTPIPSFGSYFQLYSYDSITEEKEMDFAKRLTIEYGVTAVPVSAFYHDKTENRVLRFCFSKKEESLMEAAARLQQL